MISMPIAGFRELCIFVSRICIMTTNFLDLDQQLLCYLDLNPLLQHYSNGFQNFPSTILTTKTGLQTVCNYSIFINTNPHYH
jgi:hypothetical protein